MSALKDFTKFTRKTPVLESLLRRDSNTGIFH